ncbi:YfcE family phosphodiesterase [Staphylococcus agnetis]|uniref:YfcE family phosphodiesterase n=1 Tax=Staphylococcus agnetis TaxID=985762 RepID=UPI000CD1661F|nr:metallophosphoesterase [Staphylococcus agnetis]MBY7664019.1 metallophosphoesterase [Staphylococcus agnetis]MCO4327096.1 metallophosphoesterase [Staphylococcus agnetis]MCO4357986.1 metallophosphoesterase [Staphylococcus agnetis]MCO4363354.1 metallophosphoesterase [Staphylococcus agnetis]MCO4369758.1 metallophosphoesterase [Staphylococcus agnetis]
MKLILVSDNHSETGILHEIYDKHDDADTFIHLGDSEFTYQDTELSLYRRVKGNMDFYPEFPEEDTITIQGVTFFFTHGHRMGVNQGRDMLAQHAKAQGATFAFYGHTHIARYEYLQGIHVINPGSITHSRSTEEETYAEIKLDDGEGTLNFRNRQHDILSTVPFQY